MSSQLVPPAGSAKRQVLLVEDHPITREGLAHLINRQRDLQVCGQACTAQEALSAVGALKPDLVIVDISLAGTSGLELIKDLARLHTSLPVLVLSTHDEGIYAERSLHAGAKGYVMKHEPTEQVMAAIRSVLSGGVYLSQQMRDRLVLRVARGRSAGLVSDIEQLSDRELEVFRLIGQGLSTAQIAAGLHVSVSTIETYRAHLKEKLLLKNSTELVQSAVKWSQT